jgi:hypothetical protein
LTFTCADRITPRLKLPNSYQNELLMGTFVQLPQLTIEQSSCQGHWCYLLLQLAGISIGISVMLAIALFEDNIKITLGNSVE